MSWMLRERRRGRDINRYRLKPDQPKLRLSHILIALALLAAVVGMVKVLDHKIRVSEWRYSGRNHHRR